MNLSLQNQKTPQEKESVLSEPSATNEWGKLHVPARKGWEYGDTGPALKHSQFPIPSSSDIAFPQCVPCPLRTCQVPPSISFPFLPEGSATPSTPPSRRSLSVSLSPKSHSPTGSLGFRGELPRAQSPYRKPGPGQPSSRQSGKGNSRLRSRHTHPGALCECTQRIPREAGRVHLQRQTDRSKRGTKPLAV